MWGKYSLPKYCCIVKLDIEESCISDVLAYDKGSWEPGEKFLRVSYISCFVKGELYDRLKAAVKFRGVFRHGKKSWVRVVIWSGSKILGYDIGNIFNVRNSTTV